ncbi:MAG: aminoacyl-tRNA hydrolase [Acidaminococcaceae bacterium]
MKLIVGLGNIGKEYENTRHNIGFMVVEALSKSWQETLWKKSEHALYLEHRLPEKVILVKPTTYMNLSGRAVAYFANFYHLTAADILVIQDDLDLPCGQVRIRRKGSAGGHNGIKSIQEHLGTGEFPRIKIGIGHPEHENQAVINHVLHRFSAAEAAAIAEATVRAMAAIELWLQEDLETAMQTYNQKVAKSEKI